MTQTTIGARRWRRVAVAAGGMVLLVVVLLGAVVALAPRVPAIGSSRLYLGLKSLGTSLLAATATTTPAPMPLDPTEVAALASFADHDWREVLARFVDDEGLVAYDALAADRAALDRFVSLLAVVGPTTRPALFPTRDDQLAYHLNAYNALTLFHVLNRRPGLQSVMDDQLRSFVTTKFELDGGAINLYNLENKLIRPRYQDARVHFALNCASVGCPKLPNTPFTAAKLPAELDAETARFLHEPRNVAVEDGVVVLSNVFAWYQEDFGGDPVGWIRQRAPTLGLPHTTHHRVRPWDWRLNSRPDPPPRRQNRE
jgi:hypothetical protein